MMSGWSGDERRDAGVFGEKYGQRSLTALHI